MLYICSMKKMNTAQAWADFIGWLRASGGWDSLTYIEKKMLENTGRAIWHGKCRAGRVKKAFDKYRPGVYVLEERWFKV